MEGSCLISFTYWVIARDYFLPPTQWGYHMSKTVEYWGAQLISEMLHIPNRIVSCINIKTSNIWASIEVQLKHVYWHIGFWYFVNNYISGCLYRSIKMMIFFTSKSKYLWNNIKIFEICSLLLIILLLELLQ